MIAKREIGKFMITNTNSRHKNVTPVTMPAFTLSHATQLPIQRVEPSEQEPHSTELLSRFRPHIELSF
jgi:hypothetical protein